MRVIQVGDDLRTRAVAACIERLAGGVSEQPLEVSPAEVEHIRTLRSLGLIFGGTGDDSVALHYVPSPQAKSAVFEGDGGTGWPSKVDKQLKRMREISGALFRFPVWGQDRAVEAFITDWSPFPGACAVAVHPGHPLADECGNAPDAWTGTFVRHVLTGDLLPVWTASWVKPEFGTGVVIVNPAHSQVDLDFAREVGLPVRFALTPGEAPSSDPESWIEPPVVKTGTAVRTGVADGADFQTAKEKYLDLLVAAGHATLFVDRPFPPLEIGSAGDSRSLADLRLVGSVRQVLATPLEEGDCIVCGSGAIEPLLTLRALHADRHGDDIGSVQLILVQPVAEEDSVESGGRENDLALVGFGGLEDVLAMKSDQLEQVQRFFENHAKLEPPPEGSAEKPPKRVVRILEQVREGKTDAAFAELYKLQRDIRKKPESVGAGDKAGYFDAAYVLAGLAPPDGASPSSEHAQFS